MTAQMVQHVVERFEVARTWHSGELGSFANREKHLDDCVGHVVERTENFWKTETVLEF